MILNIKNISGADKVMFSRTVADAASIAFNTRNNESLLPEIQGWLAAGEVELLEGEFAAGEAKPLKVTMNITDHPAAGATECAIGFQVQTEEGIDADQQYLFSLGVYNDAYGAVAAANATLATPTKGTILSGSGSNLLAVLTDANGEFACTLTDATLPETVYVMASLRAGSPMADVQSKDEVAFTVAP